LSGSFLGETTILRRDSMGTVGMIGVVSTVQSVALALSEGKGTVGELDELFDCRIIDKSRTMPSVACSNNVDPPWQALPVED
jgi:hypothetical protein